jgi:hypothetical protein
MGQFRLTFLVGNDTTNEMSEAFGELEESLLDELEVTWEEPKSVGVANEPISAYVIVVGGAIAVAALLRVIERRMQHLQERETMRIVAEGFEKDAQLGKQLSDLAKAYSKVAVSYGLAKEAWPPANSSKQQQ